MLVVHAVLVALVVLAVLVALVVLVMHAVLVVLVVPGSCRSYSSCPLRRIRAAASGRPLPSLHRRRDPGSGPGGKSAAPVRAGGAPPLSSARRVTVPCGFSSAQST
ncbi:hypothetical protein, partial [Streptomyces malaysiensis]|uniref:hypothetical protein n=1 Tax=Streptomyces malaysiensis TaxID=92644 RepID=UPI00341F08C3